MVNSGRILRWAVLLALTAAIPLLYGVVSAYCAQRERLREEARYADGLHPCSEYWASNGVVLDPAVLREAELLVFVHPTFDQPEVVSLSAGKVRYQYLPRPAFSGPKWLPDRAPTPRYAELPPTLARTVVDALRAEMAHTRAKGPSGVDGTTYHFLTRNACAAAWSPQSGSRARNVVDLVDALVEATNAHNHNDHAKALGKVKARLDELESR